MLFICDSVFDIYVIFKLCINKCYFINNGFYFLIKVVENIIWDIV